MGTVTTKDGTEIFYKDWGTGEPIFFHHGWPLSADDWDAQMMFFLGKVGGAADPEHHRLTVDHEFFSIDSSAPNPRIAVGLAASRGGLCFLIRQQKNAPPAQCCLVERRFQEASDP
jgi:hypothetical protein